MIRSETEDDDEIDDDCSGEWRDLVIDDLVTLSGGLDLSGDLPHGNPSRDRLMPQLLLVSSISL